MSADAWLAAFPTYEDYLDTFLSAEDFRYLQNVECGRIMVELGYRSSKDIYRPQEFLDRKQAAITSTFASKKSTIQYSRGLSIDDPVLIELAAREQPNLQKNVSTIIFVTYKLKSGFDVSGYIDFEESLRVKEKGLNWANIFSGKDIIAPQRTDLSYYHWRSSQIINNDSDNYKVVNDPEFGLMFMFKGDRKLICVNPAVNKFAENSFRSMVSSPIFGDLVLYDHIVRRRA